VRPGDEPTIDYTGPGLCPMEFPRIDAIGTVGLAWPGNSIGNCVILGELGRGGMGVVCRAHQVKLDRHVALKLIRPDVAADPGFAERFAREARAMARLNHPRIVAVHDFGESAGSFYLVMELVDGMSLRARLRQRPITVVESLAIIIQVCEALAYAHGRGVVHRDIKPENILIGRDGVVKLADFGLAKLVQDGAPDGHLTRTQQVLGTPRYMAPEQLESPREADHRADIYAVGVVLFEMLVGTLPAGSADLPSAARPGSDERLDGVVLRSLKPDVLRRYQRVEDLKGDLIRILRDQLVRALRSGDDEAVKADVVQALGGPTLVAEVLGLRAQVSGDGPPTPEGWVLRGQRSPTAEGCAPPRSFKLLMASLVLVPSGLIGPLSLISDQFRFLSWSDPPHWLIPAYIFAVTDLVLAFCVVAHVLHFWDLRESRPAGPQQIERARREVRGPARGLIAVGLLSGVSLPLGLLLGFLGSLHESWGLRPAWLFGFLGVLGSIQGLIVLYAGLRMEALESRRLALYASLLTLLPIGLGSLLGMAAGVWSLAILRRPHVVAAFQAIEDDPECVAKAPEPSDSAIAGFP
jgi:Protein kinase domain